MVSMLTRRKERRRREVMESPAVFMTVPVLTDFSCWLPTFILWRRPGGQERL